MSQYHGSKSIQDFFRPRAPPVAPPHSSSHDDDNEEEGEFIVAEVPQTTPTPSSSIAKRFIKSSDDEEDEDSSSEDGLEDLASLWAPPSVSKDVKTATITSSTPTATTAKSRNVAATPKGRSSRRKAANFHKSPLTVLPKYKFDFESLLQHAESEKAVKESSERVKALIRESEGSHGTAGPGPGFNPDILETVVPDEEEGGAKRIIKALKRTEATMVERTWSFFETLQVEEEMREDFPRAAIPRNWKRELTDPVLRYQAFTCGFVENMISLGKILSDELFLWILCEVCFETDETLRWEYANAVVASSEQCLRLLYPETMDHMFECLGATMEATDVTQKIIPVVSGSKSSATYDRACLRSVVKLIARVANILPQESKVHTTCLLLRLCIDPIVIHSLDLLSSVQEALDCLCRAMSSGNSWEMSCEEICQQMFKCIEQPTLRLRIIECMPSTDPQTHDLRRRLAMAYYFNSLAHSLEHSHQTINLELFTARLDNHAFRVHADTDYRDLSALISLLDVAVDDGQHVAANANPTSTALIPAGHADHGANLAFDRALDALSARIKLIARSIGTSGAAFLSRIEAKEILDLVAQRITTTLRLRPKPKHTWVNTAASTQQRAIQSSAAEQRSLVQQRHVMSTFLARQKKG